MDDQQGPPSKTVCRRTAMAAIAATAALPAARGQSASSAWPGRPIRVIVPYPAGGNADTVARLTGDKLGARLGATIVVENRPGASGIIGADTAAKAAPDGYTLLFTVVSQLTAPPPGVKPPYDPFKDFRPLAGIFTNALLLAGAGSAGAKDLLSMMALAKTRKLSYGSYGEGTTTHLLLQAMDRTHKLDMVHVPYRGEAPMITDLLAGTVQMGLVSIGVAREHLASGRLVPLAMVSDKRSEFMPQVSTALEQGVQNLSWGYGIAYFAPAALPDGIATRLTAELQAVVKDDEVATKLRSQNNSPWGGSPAEVTEKLRQDTERYRLLLERSK